MHRSAQLLRPQQVYLTCSRVHRFKTQPKSGMTNISRFPSHEAGPCAARSATASISVFGCAYRQAVHEVCTPVQRQCDQKHRDDKHIDHFDWMLAVKTALTGTNVCVYTSISEIHVLKPHKLYAAYSCTARRTARKPFCSERRNAGIL